MPQTIWLFMPVTTWPRSSMTCAATSPARVASAPIAASAQVERFPRRAESAIASEPLVAHGGAELQVGAHLRGRHRRDPLRDLGARIAEVAEEDRLVARRGAGLDAGRDPVAVDPVDAQRARLDAALAPRHVGLLSRDGLVHERARLV